MADLDYEGLTEDKELKDLILTEQHKMEFQQQINKLNDLCWDKCVADKTLSSKFDRKTEGCLSNCVGRFIDTSLIVTKKFTQLVSQQGR